MRFIIYNQNQIWFNNFALKSNQYQMICKKISEISINQIIN